MEAFTVFVERVFVCMPQTAALLRQTMIDAYLVNVKGDIALVADRVAGMVLSYRGFPPGGPRCKGVGDFYTRSTEFAISIRWDGPLPKR